MVGKVSQGRHETLHETTEALDESNEGHQAEGCEASKVEDGSTTKVFIAVGTIGIVEQVRLAFSPTIA